MEAYSLLANLRKGMQGSSEQPAGQPLVGEERYVTAAKETIPTHAPKKIFCHSFRTSERGYLICARNLGTKIQFLYKFSIFWDGKGTKAHKC